MLLCVSLANAAVVVSTQSGNWATGTTWVGGVKPADGDDATIRGDYIVTVNTTETLTTSGNVFEMGKWDNTGGTLNVESGGNMTLIGEVYIGVGSGTSYINIDNGGIFSATWGTRLGWGAGSKGVVTVKNDALVWFANLIVGASDGTGELHIDGGLTHVANWTIYPTGSIDITAGRLVLKGNVSNVAGITAYGGAGILIYAYDGSGWTNVTAILPDASAAVYLSVNSGNWTDGDTWSGGIKPASTDKGVIIRDNKIVTVNTVESLNKTTGNVFEMGMWDSTGGTLNVVSGGELTLTGEVYIGVGGNETSYINVSGGTFHSNYATRFGWGTGANVIATITSGSMNIGDLHMSPPDGTHSELHIDGGTVTLGNLTFYPSTTATIDITGNGELIVPGEVTDVNTTYGTGRITANGGAGVLAYDTTSQSGKTIISLEPPPFVDTIDHSMFEGGVTRAELEGFLSRSLYMGGLGVGEGAIATNASFNAGMDFVEYVDQGLDPNVILEYVAGFWSNFPSATDAYTADFDRFYNAAKSFADKAHRRNLYALLGCGVFETAFSKYDSDGYLTRPGIEDVPVPAWVFTAFGKTPETRNFSYTDMIYTSGYGYTKDPTHSRWDTTNGNACVPDMSKEETRMWFYYHCCRYIDSGYEVINLGQIGEMTFNDTDYTYTKQLIDMIRAYAATHARRHWVFLSADTYTAKYGNDLLFDYHSFPLRPKCVAGHPGEAILEAGYADSVYGDSTGGINPSGWSCDHQPYTVHFDNISGAYSADHTTNVGTPWVWNWDESAWFSHQTETYRNNWLWYASKWLKTNDPNGYICMSGLKICQDPLNFDDNLEWTYKAYTYTGSNHGMNQQETIKAIWNSTCSGYNYGNLNYDCRVDLADLAIFAQKWQNVTTGYYAIDLQDFNGDRVIDLDDLAMFVQSWLFSF
ncbi:MAG: hypothetical protein ABFD91_04570 [Anaerohalosphaeraceae bacterium]